VRRGPRRTATMIVLAAAVALVVLAPAGTASAHPLGNFTVNTYAGVVVRPGEVIIDHVVDMAEIPAFQERRAIDLDGDGVQTDAETEVWRVSRCADLAMDVAVQVDGRAAPLRSTEVGAVSFPEGSGGLTTLRISCRLTGSFDADAGQATHTITVTDSSFGDRIGWREITAVGDGMTIVRSDVPATSPSARLTMYPPDALPPAVREASLEVTHGGARLATLPGDVPDGGTSVDASAPDGLLASLAGRRDLTFPLAAAMIAIAIGAGALHALGPGHGKTLIGAYLVGAGGTLRHAVGVGVAISIMHTSSVLALGLVVVSAERVFAPEQVYPWLGLASGLVALALGSVLLVSRLGARLGHRARAAGHTHDHPATHGHRHGPDRGHDGGSGHTHEAGHDHPPLSRRGLVALAFSGGILPSPSALVVLLASMSVGRTVIGLILIAAFSLGLAGALIGIGALSLRARDMAAARISSRAARLLPIGSAAAIASMGLFLTVQGAARI